MARRSRAQRRKLARRLAGYSATATAALAVGHSAVADVIYSGQKDLLVNAANPTVPIDMDGNGGDDFLITFAGLTTTGGYLQNELNINRAGTDQAVMTMMGYGSAVASSSSNIVSTNTTMYSLANEGLLAAYNTGTPLYYSGYFPGRSGYMGVVFPDDSTVTRVGWIGFEGATDASWGRVTGWAYEDTGDAIHVPYPIPEPGGLALFALGAAGVAASRRKRG